MALPERTLQQLVAYILGLSLKLARFQACMCTLQDALTALGHLHCIQTLGLRTEPGQEAAMKDISQKNRNVIAALTVTSTGLPKPSPEKEEPGSVSPDRLVSGHIREAPRVVIAQQSPGSLWVLEPVCTS